MDWRLALQRVNSFVERGLVLREKEHPFDDSTRGEYTAWRTGAHEFLGRIDREDGSNWQRKFNEAFMKPSGVSKGAPDHAFMTKRHQQIIADVVGILAGVGDSVSNKQVEELAERERELAVDVPRALERWQQIADGEITESLRTEFSYSRQKIGTRLKRICGHNEKFRQILLRDISDAASSYAHGVSKTAVILCAGAIEGVPSELITRRPADERHTAYSRVWPKAKQAKDMRDNRLSHHLDIATELNIISKTTAKLGHGVTDYRNHAHSLREPKEEHEITNGDARIACRVVFDILDEVAK